jgi:molybdate transport system regulatory protein
MQRKWRLVVKSKVWLEAEGEPVFGEGRKQLLEAIERHGSINRAARQTGISYRRAWSYLRTMESRLGVKLIETQRGGQNGGGATLTEDARLIIKEYEERLADMEGVLNRKSKDIFDQRYAKMHNRTLCAGKCGEKG